MSDGKEMVEMSTPVGSLELPEGLLEALTGIQGEEEATHLTDLPAVVVGSILSRIPDPVDIASAFAACRLFWGVAGSAPLRLRLRPSRYQDGGGDDPGLAHRTGYDAQKLLAWTRAALTGIRSVMRSTEELDLTGCPILDDDVTALLVDLRCLDVLILDGCQKLTSSVAHALAMSVSSGPRVLSLQRCFGLGHAAAGNLLAAAAADGSRLQTMLLSHLDKLDLLREPPAILESMGDVNEKEIGEYVQVIKGVSGTNPGIGLRILALHNCGSLGYSELLAISKNYPYLEVLMLGGSVDGLGLSRPFLLTQEEVVAAASALVGVTEQLQKLRILEITFFTAPVLQAVREQVSKSIHVWDFCERYSVDEAATFVAKLKMYSQSQKTESIVFPGNRKEDLKTAYFPSKAGTSQCCCLRQRFEGRWDCVAEDILIALRAATNCSDSRRRTSLHVAAAHGESVTAANLLSIGATARGMKDSRGATALFAAAESGHALICYHLLQAGADVLASNRAGETPLYIAALRGHATAVDAMLSYCRKHRVDWQVTDLYGDGWTPLMAATVADRQEVGKVLLSAAVTSGIPLLDTHACSGGQVDTQEVPTKSAELWNRSNSVRESATSYKDSSSPQSAPQFLNAQNRYGQTALHIAARRGSSWFVRNLLEAGASLDVRDDYGLRAVDVAHKNHHSAVEKLLKQWEQLLKNSADSSVVSTSKKQSVTQKKVPSACSKGKINIQHPSSHGSLCWVPKSPALKCKSSVSTVDREVPLPDSPTSIVPSWEHSKPPLNPSFEQLPAVLVADRDTGVDRGGELADVQSVLRAEGSQTSEMGEPCRSYWRGRGVRRRTASHNSKQEPARR